MSHVTVGMSKLQLQVNHYALFLYSDTLILPLLQKLSSMADADDLLLRQFLQIVPMEPQQAKFFLEACHGNLDMALNMYTGWFHTQ